MVPKSLGGGRTNIEEESGIVNVPSLVATGGSTNERVAVRASRKETDEASLH
jgi:hypothetical protein